MLVSVVMPIFNAEQFVSQAIESILQQSYRQLELILVNDGSSDKTLAILKKYAYQDPRIKLISRANRGLVFSLNEAIDHSNGEWIVRMDADDIAINSRIKEQLDQVSRFNADICGSWTQYFGAGYPGIWRSYESDRAIKVDMLFRCPLSHPTVMVRSNILKKYKYSEKWDFAEDYDLWIRLALAGYKFTNVQKPLLKYRRHVNQISTKTYQEQRAWSKKAQSIYASVMSERLDLNPNLMLSYLGCYNDSLNVNSLEALSVFFRSMISNDCQSRKALHDGIKRVAYRVATVKKNSYFNNRLLYIFGGKFSFFEKNQIFLIRVLQATPDSYLYSFFRFIRQYFPR